MSSTVSRAMDPASPPTVPSNTSFFFSWSFRMRSSIVFSKHAVQCSGGQGEGEGGGGGEGEGDNGGNVVVEEVYKEISNKRRNE
jgi:hypothetical protein